MPPFVDLRKAARSLGRHRFSVVSHARRLPEPSTSQGQGIRQHVDMLLDDILLRSPSQNDHQSTCRQIDTFMRNRSRFPSALFPTRKHELMEAEGSFPSVNRSGVQKLRAFE